MGKVRYIDWYHDEWIAGTDDLNNAERGLYVTACCLIYSVGGPITRDRLRAACRDHGHAFNRQLDVLIQSGKLLANGEQITNKRCENELQKAVNRTEKAQRNGGKGGRPTKENKELAKADGCLDGKLTTNLSTTNQEEKAPLREPKSTTTRRKQVPVDWLPSEEGREFARDRARWSDARIEREVEHCRDHHRKKGNLFADLDAMWRTWVQQGAKFQQGQGNGHRIDHAARHAGALDTLARAALDFDERQGYRGPPEAPH